MPKKGCRKSGRLSSSMFFFTQYTAGRFAAKGRRTFGAAATGRTPGCLAPVRYRRKPVQSPPQRFPKFGERHGGPKKAYASGVQPTNRGPCESGGETAPPPDCESGRRLSTDSRGHAARSYLFLGSSLGADWNCSSSTQSGVPSGISLRLTLMSLPAKRGSSLA